MAKQVAHCGRGKEIDDIIVVYHPSSVELIVRLLIDLPDNQINALNLLGRQRKVSRAALVRESVAAYLEAQRKTASDAALEDVAGMWKDRDIDGLAYQKQLRADWDR